MAQGIAWMSTAQAAEYLGVTLRTVYGFIDEGQLPAYKFGRVIRVKEEDLQAFIESSRIAPGSLEHLRPETGQARRPKSQSSRAAKPSTKGQGTTSGTTSAGISRTSQGTTSAGISRTSQGTTSAGTSRTSQSTTSAGTSRTSQAAARPTRVLAKGSGAESR